MNHPAKNKYLLAYARKRNNKSLIDKIQKKAGQHTDPSDSVKRSMEFRKAVDEARKAGNHELALNLTLQYEEEGRKIARERKGL